MQGEKSKSKWRLQEVSRATWDLCWKKVQFANLMQSWEYGEAKSEEGWYPRRYVLLDGTDKKRGLLQVLSRELRFLGGVARINRGPVMFSDPFVEPLSDGEMLLLWRAIRREMKVRRLWYGWIAPEYIRSEEVVNILKQSRLHPKKNGVCGASIRVPLELDESSLMSGLNGKWRNLLRKSWKSGVDLQIATAPEEMEDLIQLYKRFQKEKKFTGVSETLLRALISGVGPNWQCRVLKGVVVQDLVGFVVIVEHGDTATYLLGWNSDDGRRCNVNYMLIWAAIIHARANGRKWFDMGGVTANTPKGIAHFKSGVGGTAYTLSGEFSSLTLSA